MALSGTARLSTHRDPGSARQRRRQDQRTVRALRERAPEAMAYVMEAHGRALLGFLSNILGNTATAEDVLQQVLLEVWQRGADYDPERAGLLTWLLTIARSRAVDELRRRTPEPVDPTTDTLETGVEADSEIDQLLEQWRMAGLLARLPREEAELLRLRFYEGLSQTEIADSTGVALGTVKARMVKGLCQLRSLLELEEGLGVQP
ncbi:RNA polymerase sigma factor [Conexibacter sp. S30A1]|uniref:RNA polymerase sigma factor n=1 Tax=Conexibacter sp. S30A1 TaxID=2937800 RepID=UPI0020102613|nr:sigma-70 family RNA polymerase sigma factor [Conexibacter sp. S30A1]